jgi:uncharacterized delta-60 repeat protein
MESRELMSRGFYLTAGGPDPSFGVEGVVALDYAPTGSQPLAVQADEKVLAAGVERGGVTPGRAVLARLNADGSPDSSFGTNGNGKVEVALDGRPAEPAAVAVAADGSIYVAGRAASTDPVRVSGDVFVARFGPTGTADATFGQGGIAIIDVDGRDDAVTGLLLQPDGAAVVAGSDAAAAGPTRADPHLLLLRLNPNGTPDVTFGDGGRTIADLPGDSEEVAGLAAEPGGGFVVAARNAGPSATSSALLRFSAAGIADTGFGVRTVAESLSAQVVDLEVAARGRTLVAATVGKPGRPRRAAVLAFEPRGTIDRSFGQRGRVTVPSGVATGMAISPDGDILLAAVDTEALGTPDDLTFRSALLTSRWSSRGRADVGYGTRGTARAFEGPTFSPAGFAASPTGRPVVGLYRDGVFDVARLESAAVPAFGRVRGGALRVTGTAGPDVVDITEIPATDSSEAYSLEVNFNGFVRRFAAAGIQRVVISGAGDDDVLSADRLVTVPAKLVGGEGNDRLTGGAAADLLAGGPGDDVLISRDGAADRLDGGVDTVTRDERDDTAGVEVYTA